MDSHDLDYHITRLLCRNGRTSNRDIAQTLGVSETTVRNRVQRLLKNGSIQIVARPNPLRLGSGLTGNLRLKVRTGSAVSIGRRLCRFDALWYIARVAGPFDFDCEYVVRSQNEIGKLKHQIERMEGIVSFDISLLVGYLKNFLGFGFTQNAVDVGSHETGQPLDRDIQRILSRNGRTPNRKIARELGVSETTVRMRVQKLIAAQQLKIAALPNPLKLDVGIVGGVRIRSAIGHFKAVGAALQHIDALWYVAQLSGEDDFDTEFFVKSHRDVVDVVQRIETIPGIVDADLTLPLATIKNDPKVGQES